MIRDFIYLDTERLRSYAAQLLEGLPESATTDRGHEAGGKGGAEAGLWKVVRAGGELDYRYRRAASETRSLHHHVYELFEAALEDEGFIRTIDGSFDYGSSWNSSELRDGDFLKVYGEVRLIDYGRAVAAMEGFPKLFKSFNTVQTVNIKDQEAAGQISADEAKRQRRELQKMQAEIKQMPVGGIASLGRELYPEGVLRFKARPAGAPSPNVLVGNAAVENLLGSTSTTGLLQSPHGSMWVAVGQVAPGGESAGLQPMRTGNQMEDAIDELAAAFDELANVGSAAVFPALGFTPLAVYREVPPGSA